MGCCSWRDSLLYCDPLINEHQPFLFAFLFIFSFCGLASELFWFKLSGVLYFYITQNLEGRAKFPLSTIYDHVDGQGE
jgi:hypothetical protein